MKCELLINNYLQCLKKDFKCYPYEKGCHIVTPFLRPDNDAIEIYIYNDSPNRYKITDEGSTFEYLFLHGIDIDMSTKRKDIIEAITKRTLTYFDGTDLYTYANDIFDFSTAINNLISAIQSLCCMTYTGKESSKTTFKEEVKAFLQSKNLLVHEKFSIEGYAETQIFDIAVIKSKINVIEPITSSSSAYANILAERIAYRFTDVRRKTSNFKGIVVINDEEDVWSPDTIKIIQSYADAFTGWKERDRLIELIA